MVKTVCIIGRGHSGTRIPSVLLSENGAFMGDEINESGDKGDWQLIYEAAEIFGDMVGNEDFENWDFDRVMNEPVPDKAKELIYEYLEDVLDSKNEVRGWKLPENTLIFPWLVKLFPDFHYIYWVRNPFDCILNPHITDDLVRWKISGTGSGMERLDRAISWLYQYKLVRATEKPKNFLRVKYEDYILGQENELERLGSFLEMPLERTEVYSKRINVFREEEARSEMGRAKYLVYPFRKPKKFEEKYQFLLNPMVELGYMLMKKPVVEITRPPSLHGRNTLSTNRRHKPFANNRENDSVKWG